MTEVLAFWPGWTTEVLESRQTAQGQFQIVQAGMDGYGLVLQGKLLRELEAYRVSVYDVYPAGYSPVYLLVVINKGGGSCPREYRLLDVASAQKTVLTGEFGNCSAKPTLHAQDQGILIDFPPWQGNPAQSWFYQPGTGRLRPTVRT